jgi:hypothetical protein
LAEGVVTAALELAITSRTLRRERPDAILHTCADAVFVEIAVADETAAKEDSAVARGIAKAVVGVLDRAEIGFVVAGAYGLAAIDFRVRSAIGAGRASRASGARWSSYRDPVVAVTRYGRRRLFGTADDKQKATNNPSHGLTIP